MPSRFWRCLYARARLRPGAVVRLVRLLLVCTALAATGTTAAAEAPPVTLVPSDWSLRPSGVDAGAQFRLLFITKTTRQAANRDIEAYNGFVQTTAAEGLAAIRPYAPAFRVVGSTAAVDARDNTYTTGTGMRIYWLNGNKAADDYADFYDGTWDEEVTARLSDGRATTAHGTIYTGSLDDGTASEHPLGRSEDDTDAKATIGHLNDSGQGENPLTSPTAIANVALPFYGLSPVFEVAAAGTPLVTRVAISSDGGDDDQYVTGETVAATVTFSNAVTVDLTNGTPHLALKIGANVRNAAYAAGDSTATALVFAYTVVAGDHDEDGIAIGADALALNGAAIEQQGAAAADVSLSHFAVAADREHRVNRRPFIGAGGVAVTSRPQAAAKTYGFGETIEVTVTFNEAVTVDTTNGTPSVEFKIFSTARQARYVRGSGSAAPVFAYTVAAGDTDNNGIWIGSDKLSLAGASIKRTGSDVDAQIGHAEVGTLKDHKVDASLGVGTVSSVAITSTAPGGDGAYEPGDVIEVTVTFSDAVTVDTTNGTPYLALQVGAHARNAVYAAGDSTATALVFSYTVVAADRDGDGIAIGANALATNGGAIVMQTAVAADASLSHSAVAAAAAHRVNLVPVIVSGGVAVTSTPPYATGDVIVIAVTFDAPVTVAGDPQFELSLGERAVYADYASGAGTAVLVFSYTVQVGDLDTDGIAIGADKVIRDADDAIGSAAGVPANLAHQALGTLAEHRVFLDVPRIVTGGVAITSTPVAAADRYGVGETIEVSVTFTEPVTVDTAGGRPYYLLPIGPPPIEQAAYARGSGTATLVFAFRVPSVADSGYDAPSGVPTATGVIFLGAHRVRLNGATIRSASSSLDAALSHAGSGYHEHEVDQLLEQPRVTLKLTPRSISENGGVSTVTAWVSPTSATAFTLEVAAAAVAPAAATDFTLSANRTLSFAPRSGRSTGTVTITAADDSLDAADKQVTVSASLAPATAWVVAPDAVTLEIVDDDGVPDAPANLVATAGDGTAKLRWDGPRALANVSAHEYRQRSGSDSFADTWTTIPMSAVGGANEAGYTVGSLTNDTAYTFQVRARNAAGAGDPSNTAAATPQALTATFRTIPATHDGVHEFSVEILFSVGIASSARIRDGVQLTGGSRKRSGRVDDRADLWSYTVGPSGDADVVITLPVPADCAAADAICSGDGRPLSAALSGTVARAALPEISIAPQSDRESVTEGQPARFTLTRSGPDTYPLTVAVDVTQAGMVISTSSSDEPPANVTFRAGAHQATLTVETQADRVDEADGTISVALVAAPAYTVADAASASVEVQDDDAPRFTVAIAGPAQVDEDAGELSLTVTATTEDNHAPDRGHDIEVVTQGTASGAGTERDYTYAPFRFEWTAAEFAANPAGTAYEVGATLVFRITDDSRQEGDETVIVIANRARHTFTIRDNDELPSAPRSLTAEAGFEQAVLSWTAPVNAGRTPIVRYEYRVSSDGGVSWSPDWTAVPPASAGGDAADATGYTVSGLDNDTPYTFEVRAVNTDGAGTAAQRAATPTAVNTAPVFDSGSAAFEVEENATQVGRVAATDDDPGDRVTGYAIVGGVDRAQLSIVAETGALSFTAAPDFENAQDQLSLSDPLNSSGNNEYLLVVRATSGTGARQQTADQTVLVTVTDVQEPPAAPAAPAVSADSETRLSVAWVEPANTGPRITGYQVRYRTSAPQGDWTEKRYSAGSRRVTIRGLAGDTAYDVQVRAVNDEGDGDWSPPAAARTNANALPVFTAASAAFEVGENGVRVGLVQASDPDSADSVTGSAIVGGADAAAFGLLRGGILRFNEKPNFEAPTDALGTSPASAAGDNRYVLVVRATSGTGARERFADLDIVVTVTDRGGEPPAKPARPEVVAASATSLRVTWAPPENSGPPITDYDYRYRAASSPQWIEVTDTAVPGSSATIADLTADTYYNVQVRATNADGTSQWSYSRSARTSANAAPAFSDVAVAFIVPENRTAVGTVVATDSDGDDDVTGYAIVDGRMRRASPSGRAPACWRSSRRRTTRPRPTRMATTGMSS